VVWGTKAETIGLTTKEKARMRFLLGTAIVLVVTAIGALIPFAFKERMGVSLGGAIVCDMLGTGVKLGHLDREKRKLLIDAANDASDISVNSKAIFQRAKAGCR
jgi:hypothetical protein